MLFLSLSLSLLSLNQSFVPHFLKRPRNRLKKSGDKICSNAQRSTRQIRGHGALSADAEHPPSSAPLRTARSTAMMGRQGNCTSHQGPKPDPRKARTSRVCVEDLCFEDPYSPSKRSLQPCRLTALKQHQRSRPGWPLSYPVASPPAKVEKTLVPADEPVTTRVPPTLPQANFAPSRNVATPSAVRAKDICRL